MNPFLGTNVRTYVRHGDRGGVYFLSLEATSRLAVHGARILNHLPYRYARGLIRIDDASVTYRLRRADRSHSPAGLDARYGPAGPAVEPAAGSLEHFLLERYCLYTRARSGKQIRTDIHHPPWRIHPAHAQLRHTGLVPVPLQPLGAPDLVHVARRQDVVVWRPVRA